MLPFLTWLHDLGHVKWWFWWLNDPTNPLTCVCDISKVIQGQIRSIATFDVASPRMTFFLPWLVSGVFWDADFEFSNHFVPFLPISAHFVSKIWPLYFMSQWSVMGYDLAWPVCLTGSNNKSYVCICKIIRNHLVLVRFLYLPYFLLCGRPKIRFHDFQVLSARWGHWPDLGGHHLT